MTRKSRFRLCTVVAEKQIINQDYLSGTQYKFWQHRACVADSTEATKLWFILKMPCQVAIICGTTGRYLRYIAKTDEYRYRVVPVKWVDDCLVDLASLPLPQQPTEPTEPTEPEVATTES